MNNFVHVAWNFAAYPLGWILLCGNMGTQRYRQMHFDSSAIIPILPDEIIQSNERRGRVLNYRGGAAAGDAVEIKDKSGNDSLLVKRTINKRRGDISKLHRRDVSKALTRAARQGIKPSQDTVMVMEVDTAPSPPLWMPRRFSSLPA